MTSGRIRGTEPILCAHLIRPVDEALVDMLANLPAGEWDTPVVAPSWRVRDVVAHLLDTALRKLSMVRDGCFVERAEIRAPRDVIDLVNRLNREGVTVYRRLSPPLLIEWMRSVCDQSARFHESLDPYAPAAFPVSWAGEDRSLNWFDTARELTERWHHQQQIRIATNRPGCMEPEIVHAVLDCFARGLPYLYRNFDAPVGATLLVEIPGDSGGRWFLRRAPSGWDFLNCDVAHPDARVTIPPAVAWRLCTKGMSREVARAQVVIEGDSALGERVLDLVAIVG